MVFTSIPAAYLDAPNWQQQQQNHQSGNSGSTSQQLLPPPPPQPHGGSSGGGGGSIRPGSMADRARMANLPIPEVARKCPRCESTNTKFCYYNNYSLTQPRHFCKTCRRYWTHGGALRNVPVGGGCRRNKRTKGGGSGSSTTTKSPASSDRQTGSVSSTNSVSSNSTGSAADIVGLAPHMPSSLRFMHMAPLHHQQFTDFGVGAAGDMGLNYGLSYSPISGPMGGGGGGGGVGDLSFHIGSALGGGGSILSASGLEQLRMMPPQSQQQQQFPFLEGLPSPAGLYPFEGSAHHHEVITGYGGGGSGGLMSHVRPKVSTSGIITQLASVKMEDSNRELNLSTSHFLGSNNNNNNPASEQYWTSAGGGASAANWTDISGFSSSSNTSNNQM